MGGMCYAEAHPENLPVNNVDEPIIIGGLVAALAVVSILVSMHILTLIEDSMVGPLMYYWVD
jgi:hypothetical protein